MGTSAMPRLTNLSQIADIAAMLNPPEIEARQIMKLCPDNAAALVVAEQCISIMAETECEEVINYWRKVYAFIHLHGVKH